MSKLIPFTSPMEQVACIGTHEWSVARLITLSKDLPIMNIPLNHLSVYSRYDKLTLRELVGHVKAVLDADVYYPIILDADGDIMDGRHRVMKAILEGHNTIRAVRFDVMPPPCRIHTKEAK